jgi:hypothetical protein
MVVNAVLPIMSYYMTFMIYSIAAVVNHDDVINRNTPTIVLFIYFPIVFTRRSPLPIPPACFPVARG